MIKNIVAIHQPNFFPWLAYFDKIVRSDIFIFLDDVQFPKTGGVWSNRVKLLIAKEVRWLTAPIVRDYHGIRKINEMEFCSDIPWRKKMIKTLKINYKKAPCFSEAINFFEPLIQNPENNIANYNYHAILTISKQIGLSVDKFYRSSEIVHFGTSNERLVSLTKAVGGSIYLCGSGSDGYLNEYVFHSAGVELQYQQFNHPTYAQKDSGNFQVGLSIFDAIANLGWKGLRKLLGLTS